MQENRPKVHDIGKWNGLKGPCIKFSVFVSFHEQRMLSAMCVFKFKSKFKCARMEFIHCGTFSLKMNHIEEASAVQKIYIYVYIYSENCNRNELNVKHNTQIHFTKIRYTHNTHNILDIWFVYPTNIYYKWNEDEFRWMIKIGEKSLIFWFKFKSSEY